MTGPRRTPNRHNVGAASAHSRKWAFGVCAAILAMVGLFAIFRETHMAHSKRLGPILAILGIASTGSTAPTSGAPLANLPVPVTQIGINLSPPAAYSPNVAFANLAIVGPWQQTIAGSPAVPITDLDVNGYPKSLPEGRPLFRLMNWPSATNAATVRCTFQGRASLSVAGKSVSGVQSGNGFLTFRWSKMSPSASDQIILRLDALDPAAPLRNLDCRDDKLAKDQRFDPQFLALARSFKVVRFMDWQRVNDNGQISWATRRTPASIDIRRADGVSVEDMMDLVNQIGADPWFNMPWNTDDEYIRNFAQYVHDHLPRGRRVYVEAGNEVWNARFPVSRQALAEGQSEGLSPNLELARLYRYAERLAQVMDVWAKVFADRPGQLVRVANCQNGGYRSDIVLGYKDTARHVDALATAPYFGAGFHKTPPADVDAAFAQMDAAIATAFDNALKAKATAAKYGKRYIAYEAGQHIVLDDGKLEEAIQRDPRMYEIYKKYLDIWRRRIGDTIMMYNSVQPIARTGAWGMLEYSGQPLSEAPKMRAVLEAQRQQ